MNDNAIPEPQNLHLIPGLNDVITGPVDQWAVWRRQDIKAKEIRMLTKQRRPRLAIYSEAR